MTTASAPANEAHANLRAAVVHESALRDTFREDVLEGLAGNTGSQPASSSAPRQKRIDPKYLYDARGSKLFEQICALPEYYPTRTEAAIFDECLDEVAASLGAGVTLIEPGSGSGEKAERLLAALDDPRAYVPIEISGAALADSARRLAARFPNVEIWPLRADFAAGEPLPESLPAERRVVFFPGSTIGNLERSRRAALLQRFAAILGPGGQLLIGFDLVKDVAVLEAAYDDDNGVTAAFNLNLLDRMNRELGADFDPARFRHAAPWTPEHDRIEMRLVSTAAQEVTVAGRPFSFRPGEHIHTESSHKFTVAGFDEEARLAGFEAGRCWLDARGWFCVAVYRAERDGTQASRPSPS